MPHQARELSGALAQCGFFNEDFNILSTRIRVRGKAAFPLLSALLAQAPVYLDAPGEIDAGASSFFALAAHLSRKFKLSHYQTFCFLTVTLPFISNSSLTPEEERRCESHFWV